MRNDAHGGTVKANAILVRRVRPSDTEELSTFYAALSQESLRARFLGYASGITGTTSRSFCTLDHMHDEGFVALAREGSGERVVGHVCLASVGSHQLELGIAVSDEYQGRGIGRGLFEAATAWARERHFTSIVASCFTDNSGVLALLTSAPFGADVAAATSGVVDVVIPLEPPLPKAFSAVIQPRRKLSRTTRVVWRHRPQPGRGAGGSASRGSS